MTNQYDDIINLPHHISSRHKPMPVEARAAQFAPFAALTGHDTAIAETARLTSTQLLLSAEEQQALSQKIAYAMSMPEQPLLTITYFQPDTRKTGGAYLAITGTIKKIEETLNLLTLTDGTQIPLTTIADIDSDAFTDIDR